LRRLLFLGITAVALVAIGVATAGTGGNKTGQACYKGMYASYIDPSTGTFFTSQAVCVSFVANGGTLTADVDLALSNPAPGGRPSFSLHNNSATLSSTYTVQIQWNIGGGPVQLLEWVVDSSGCIESQPLPGYVYPYTCTGTIGPGQSVNLLHVIGANPGTTMIGIASITQAQYPDPVTTNNALDINFTG
jgi:hypothetical protein